MNTCYLHRSSIKDIWWGWHDLMRRKKVKRSKDVLYTCSAETMRSLQRDTWGAMSSSTWRVHCHGNRLKRQLMAFVNLNEWLSEKATAVCSTDDTTQAGESMTTVHRRGLGHPQCHSNNVSYNLTMTPIHVTYKHTSLCWEVQKEISFSFISISHTHKHTSGTSSGIALHLLRLRAAPRFCSSITHPVLSRCFFCCLSRAATFGTTSGKDMVFTLCCFSSD